MKNVLALAPLALLSGCMYSARPIEPAAEIRPARSPRWQSASVTGLTYRDERVAARAETTDVSLSGAVATTSYNGNVNASGIGISSGNNTVYEAYENTKLQKYLTLALEDSGLVKAIIPGSDIVIEGIPISLKPASDWTDTTCNILSSITLTCIFGMPLTGKTEAVMQLRVRDRGALISKATGTSKVSWLIHRPGDLDAAKDLAEKTAIKQALIRAVQELQRQSPAQEPAP